jgi:hypothetical protein
MVKKKSHTTCMARLMSRFYAERCRAWLKSAQRVDKSDRLLVFILCEMHHQCAVLTRVGFQVCGFLLH